MARSFFQRTGYDVFITIGGGQVPRSWIIDRIRITKTENQATIAVFSLLNPPGLQVPEVYQGASVWIDIRTTGGFYRAFTGIIDVPELDLINQITTYTCTDNRENKIKALHPSFVASIGYYSTTVFGTSKDVTEELQKRLSTVPQAVDFDNYGNPMVTPWQPKGSPDISLGPTQVFYIEPKVDFSSRIKTTNTVSITLDYTFQRLHQQSLSFVWSGTYFSQFCTYWREGRPSFPAKEMIRSAAQGVGWQIVGGFSFEELWPAQGFNCGGWIIWQPNSVQSEYKNATDSSGNTKTDSAGNAIQEQSRVTITDTSSHLCRSARWRARLRFAQNVIEKYTLTMTAPQSVAKYGTVDAQDSLNLSAEFDTTTWEQSNSDPYNYGNSFSDADHNRGELNTAMIVSLNKARTTLLASHRDVSVYFKTPIMPFIDLHHTVQINTGPLKCRGKVKTIEHEINIQTTEAKTSVTLALSRLAGSASNSALNPPAPPFEDTSYIGSPKSIILQSHYGVDPTSDRAKDWNGHIANKFEQQSDGRLVRTQFNEVFIVDTPKIPDTIRNNRELGQSAVYTVAIPNDYLEVTY